MMDTPCDSRLLLALTSTLNLGLALQRSLFALDSIVKENVSQKNAKKQFPADGVFMNIYNPEENMVYFFASASRTEAKVGGEHISVDEGSKIHRNERSESIYFVGNLNEDRFTQGIAPKVFPEIQSFLMMKLKLEGERIGIVCFWSKIPHAFTQKDADLLKGTETLFALNSGFYLSAILARRSSVLSTENKQLAASLSTIREEPLSILLKNTPSLRIIANDIKLAARFDENLLITGESGTGKEVVAQTVHALSKRSRLPFVRVNCSAIPESLFESELFGHEAGAFTNAVKRRIGLFEEADGGTLFLDEIGELPLSMQAKLLHTLQNKTIRRVGGTADITVDVRIIGATNRNLEKLVQARAFRLDLFYRLNVLPIHLKPLRERPEDLEPLAKLFIRRYTQAYGLSSIPILTPTAIEEASSLPWPGNVRELKNIISRTLMQMPTVITHLQYTHDDSMLSMLEINHEKDDIQLQNNLESSAFDTTLSDSEILSFENMQKRYFANLLQKTQGRIAGPQGAAAIAGLNVNTMRSRLKRLGFKRFQNS